MRKEDKQKRVSLSVVQGDKEEMINKGTKVLNRF